MRFAKNFPPWLKIYTHVKSWLQKLNDRYSNQQSTSIFHPNVKQNSSPTTTGIFRLSHKNANRPIVQTIGWIDIYVENGFNKHPRIYERIAVGPLSRLQYNTKLPVHIYFFIWRDQHYGR